MAIEIHRKIFGHRCQAAGFSLAEFLLVAALLGIFISLAVPGLRHLQTGRALRAQANDLLHAIHFARHAALTAGDAVAICPSRDGTRCHYAAGWESGWLVFRTPASSSAPQVAADADILLSHTVSAPVRITANRQAFTLRSNGRRSTNGTVMFCDPRGQVAARRLVVSYTGKPRVERVAADNPLCGNA